MLALRLTPTLPFTITSILAGRLEINIFKFMLGSTIGISHLDLLKRSIFLQGRTGIYQRALEFGNNIHCSRHYSVCYLLCY